MDSNNPTGYAQILEETTDDGTSQETRTYLIGNEIFSQTDATNGVLFLFKDGRGSTRMVMTDSNPSGLEAVYHYDGFGNPLGFDPATAVTSILFKGEQTDATGLQYVRERYYDPSIGRFNRMATYMVHGREQRLEAASTPKDSSIVPGLNFP